MKLADRFRRHPAEVVTGETVYHGPSIARAKAAQPPHRPQHAAGQPLLSAPVAQSGSRPAPVPQRLANLRAAPTFTPRKAEPNAETRPIPVAGARPYVQAEVRPVIGDSMPPLAAGPEVPAAVYGPERAPTPSLFAGPGWAGRLMSIRVRSGEWTDVQALAEQGLGRNAADEAAARRHFSSTVAEGVLQRCSVIGHPELAGLLLQRTQELVVAARAQKAGAQ
jgi:hypothetical protein